MGEHKEREERASPSQSEEVLPRLDRGRDKWVSPREVEIKGESKLTTSLVARVGEPRKESHC